MIDISSLNLDLSKAVLTASRPFTLNGVNYVAGDNIPPEELPEPRRARRLFELRYFSASYQSPTPESTPEPTPAPSGAQGGAKKGGKKPARGQSPNDGGSVAPTGQAPATEPQQGATFDPATVSITEGYLAAHQGHGRYTIRGPNGDVPGEFRRDQVLHLMG